MEDYLEKQKIIAKYSAEKWREVEEDRRRKANPLDLIDKNDKPFWFVLSPALLALISETERNRGFLASLKLPKRFLDQLASETEKKEAYYSSHIEGAVTSSAANVMQMMDSYVQWVNSASEIHPLIKAALVHLYFVHVHPFDDGNGRSARALSNLYLMKQDDQFINFLAPSDYFDHHRSEYYREIQNAEAHGSDATFFILYDLTALAEQLKDVQTEIEKETKVRDIHDLLSQKDQAKLDRKQVKALQWMLEHSEKMTTKKYCKLAQCSDETARKDFNRLLEVDLIQKIGDGRTTAYVLKNTVLSFILSYYCECESGSICKLLSISENRK